MPEGAAITGIAAAGVVLAYVVPATVAVRSAAASCEEAALRGIGSAAVRHIEAMGRPTVVTTLEVVATRRLQQQADACRAFAGDTGIEPATLRRGIARFADLPAATDAKVAVAELPGAAISFAGAFAARRSTTKRSIATEGTALRIIGAALEEEMAAVVVATRDAILTTFRLIAARLPQGSAGGLATSRTARCAFVAAAALTTHPAADLPATWAPVRLRRGLARSILLVAGSGQLLAFAGVRAGEGTTPGTDPALAAAGLRAGVAVVATGPVRHLPDTAHIVDADGNLTGPARLRALVCRATPAFGNAIGVSVSRQTTPYPIGQQSSSP
jgi:hypothetical protein